MKITLILALLVTSVSPTFGQQAIANKPLKVFGPVKSIRYKYLSYNFSRDKTRIEEILPNSRTVVNSFTPQCKLISSEVFERDGRFSGTKSIYTYDAAGRLSEANHYLLGSHRFKEVFSYSDDGRRVTVTRLFETDKRSETEIENYDEKGNITKALFYDVDGSLKETESYKYDNKGNPTEFVTYNGAGKLLFKETYKYEFDSYGNWIREHDRSWSMDTGKLREEPKVIIERSITYY